MKRLETASIVLMKRASGNDKAYFARLNENNRTLPCPVPPSSLADMFLRLETVERQLGPLATPGRAGSDRGDLKSHLDYLVRIQAIGSAKRT